MRLELQARNLKLSRSIVETIQHLGQSRLDQFNGHIRSARLQLSDMNGSRGGVDKLGRLTLKLVNGSSVHITGKHSGVLPLAATIFDRASEAVSRFFGRLREKRHALPDGA